MNAHQDLLRQIQHLNRDGIVCLLDFAVIISAAAMFRRTPMDQPASRAFTVVPRTDPAQPLTVDAAPECYFLTNRRVEVTYASPQLLDWLQTTLDVVKEGWDSFVDGHEELKRVWELWMVAAQTHQPFNYTVRCKSAEGRVAHAFVRVRPWFSPAENEMVGFMGTVHAQCLPARVLLDGHASAS